MPYYVKLKALEDGIRVGAAPVSTEAAGTLIRVDMHAADGSLQEALRSGDVLVEEVTAVEPKDWVVAKGGTVTRVKLEPTKVRVIAGELEEREAEGETEDIKAIKLAIKAADKAKDRYSLVRVKTSTGVCDAVDGTLADPGEATIPAGEPGYVSLAVVYVPANPRDRSPAPMTITDVRPRP